MSVLETAAKLTSSERQADYGHPLDDFQGSAEILRVLVRRRYHVDIIFTPDFIGLLMAVAIKGSREAGKHKLDNLVDMSGYARTIEMCLEEKEKRDAADKPLPADGLRFPAAANSSNSGEAVEGSSPSVYDRYLGTKETSSPAVRSGS